MLSEPQSAPVLLSLVLPERLEDPVLAFDERGQQLVAVPPLGREVVPYTPDAWAEAGADRRRAVWLLSDELSLPSGRTPFAELPEPGDEPEPAFFFVRHRGGLAAPRLPGTLIESAATGVTLVHGSPDALSAMFGPANVRAWSSELGVSQEVRALSEAFEVRRGRAPWIDEVRVVLNDAEGLVSRIVPRRIGEDSPPEGPDELVWMGARASGAACMLQVEPTGVIDATDSLGVRAVLGPELKGVNIVLVDGGVETREDGGVRVPESALAAHVKVTDFSYEVVDWRTRTDPGDHDGHGTMMAGLLVGEPGSGAYAEKGGLVQGAALHFFAVGQGRPYAPSTRSFDAQAGHAGSSRLMFEHVGVSRIVDAALLVSEPAPILCLPLTRDGRGGGHVYGPTAFVLDDRVNQRPDLVAIAAAGNGGVAGDAIQAPGSCKNVITVGLAADPRPKARGTIGQSLPRAGEAKADAESSAPALPPLFGGVKPDVVAPGTDIVVRNAPEVRSVTPVDSSEAAEPEAEIPWRRATGTSLATGVVTAIVACLQAKVPASPLQAHEAKALLITAGARDTWTAATLQTRFHQQLAASANPEAAGFVDRGGWGRVSLDSFGAGADEVRLYRAVGLSQGEQAILGRRDGHGDLVVGIAWTEAASWTGSGQWTRSHRLVVQVGAALWSVPVVGPQVVMIPEGAPNEPFLVRIVTDNGGPGNSTVALTVCRGSLLGVGAPLRF